MNPDHDPTDAFSDDVPGLMSYPPNAGGTAPAAGPSPGQYFGPFPAPQPGPWPLAPPPHVPHRASVPVPPRARPTPGHARRRARGRTWLVVGLVLATVLVGGSVVLVAQRMAASSVASPASAPLSPTADVRSGSVASGPVASVSGTDLVVLRGTATQHPAAATVVQLLDRHFAAINRRDYAAWADTVVADRAADQERASWLDDYRSTSDGSVVVTAISAGATGLVVELSFVSTQDPVDAPSDLPAGRICWNVQWPVEDISTGGRIGTPARDSTTKREC